MDKNEDKNEVLLTSDELVSLAHELSSIMNQMSISNTAIDLLSISQLGGTRMGEVTTSKLLSDIYEQQQFFIDKLDNVAGLLYNNNQKEELEAMKKG